MQELDFSAFTGKECGDGLQMSPLLPILFTQNGDDDSKRIILGDSRQVPLKGGAIDTFFHQSFPLGRIEVFLPLFDIRAFKGTSSGIIPAALKLHGNLRQGDSSRTV
jgi:hypothetical protein